MNHWIYNDGGRALAGFRGQANDCVCRAIAIAEPMRYLEIYYLLNAIGKRERGFKGRSTARNGVYKETISIVLKFLGWKWTPTMSIGSGCRVHLRASELPSGCIIVSLSKHVCAVINGVIHDTHDPSRNGTRCVYGYWSKP